MGEAWRMIRALPEGAVTLRRLPVPEDTGPMAELAVQGRPAPQPLPGAVLEAAFECDGRTLLFMTEDVPHEDALQLHLLDERLQLLDSATLSSMYATGSFALIGTEPPRSVRFRFFGGTDWTVELLGEPAMRLPLISEPRGVHRRLGFTRHFKVHGRPQPER
jgi:hypothetical protein